MTQDETADDLLSLGCDLFDVGALEDAEACFRRAAEQGSAAGLFNLGNTLRELGRRLEAVDAFERAAAAGESDAWLNLGLLLADLGDLAGAMRAYRRAVEAGDLQGAVELGFELRAQGEFAAAEQSVAAAARAGHTEASAVLACWQWCATQDLSLEPALRAGADHFPSARADLGHLLAATGRVDEARSVFELGAASGERESFLPLGNLLADVLGDGSAAEAAYRRGIRAGDTYCLTNLAVLFEQRGDVAAAVELFVRAEDEGDALAAQHLRRLRAEGW